MAFREIYGLGQQARIQALPLAELEALADALLDFQSAATIRKVVRSWRCSQHHINHTP